MTAKKTPHPWSVEALLAKAQRYSDLMLEHNPTGPAFGLYSSFVLEFLARASVATISPALLANERGGWHHIYFALGHSPKNKKYSPSSVAISEVVKRLQEIFPQFTDEMLNFFVTHLNRRNSELHTGDLPFDNLGTSAWQPMFYTTCEMLLKIIGKDLEFLFGKDTAEDAQTLILAHKDEAANAVKKDINAHSQVWENKETEEKKQLAEQAKVWASRKRGHRVDCPACNNAALVQGTAISSPTHYVEEDFIVEKQNMRPSSFECIACGLKISGFSKLNAAGVGEVYIATSYYEAAEYFDLTPEDPWHGMEEDFNEPY